MKSKKKYIHKILLPKKQKYLYPLSDDNLSKDDLSAGINNYTDTDYNDLVTDHAEIKRKRNELDQKMRDVYEADNTDMAIMDNSSSYITLTWTVLAISLLYYLFRKL